VGIRPNDIVQNTHNYAVFIGGILNHLGMQSMGAAVVATGTGRTLRQLDIMKQFGSTVLFSTPSYALYIAKAAEDNNIDVRELKIRLIVGGGEPGYLIPNVADRIKIVWNIKQVGDLLGANEWGMIAFACESESCLHSMEDYGLFEIINPDTGHPVKEGEVGELVLTHLDREAHPLVRWRTGDLVRRDDGICACGRTSRIFPGGIIGRVDDMIKVRGVKIFPSTIDETLGRIEGLSGEYQIVVERALDELDSFLLKVEYKQEVKDIEGLKREILKELSRTILLRPELEMVAEGTLPRWATKAKRIFDKRKEKEFKEYLETQRRLGE
jgi:phenylacetate-CoA ligase